METLAEYLQSHPKKYLIYDLDETIVRLRLPWDDYFNPIEAELRELHPHFYQEYVDGRIDFSEVINMYAKLGPHPRILLQSYNRTFESQLQGIDINHHLVDFIKNDMEHVNYIWSSNSRSTVEKALRKVKLLPKFKLLVTRDDVNYIKPHFEGFHKLFLDGTELREYLFIGDSDADKEVAEKVGIDFFRIDYFSKRA